MKLPLGNNEEEPEVSMSPLIDCVFLLLIFFLVSTMTKVKSRDIPVNLPTSEAAVKLKPANFLHEQLREVCIATPDRRIRIDMDRDTPFGRFVEVMDACQFYNLNNIGIRTYDEHYNEN